MGNTNLDIKRFYPEVRSLPRGRNQLAIREREGCTKESPCGRLPCHACGLAVRKWFTGQMLDLFGNHERLDAVSIITERHMYADWELHDAKMKEVARYHRDIIKRSKLGDRPWLGAIDISCNTTSSNPDEDLWSLHAMLITPRLSDGERSELRSRLRSSALVQRPLRRSEVYDLEGISAYAFKPNFNTRYQYVDATGRKNTFSSLLKGRQLKTLSDEMSSSWHQDRLITIGLRRHGSRLVKI